MAQDRTRLDFTIGRSVGLIRRIKAMLRMILNWIKGLAGIERMKGLTGCRTMISQRTFTVCSFTVCWLSASSSVLIMYALLFTRWFINPTDQWGRVVVFVLGLSYWMLLTIIIAKAMETYGIWKAASMVQSKRSRTPKLDRLLKGVK